MMIFPQFAAKRRNFTPKCRKTQNAAKRHKMLQFAAIRCKMPQNAAKRRNAIRRNLLQNAAKRHNTPQNAILHDLQSQNVEFGM